VKYLPPFELIKRYIDIQPGNGDLRVNMTYDEFINIHRRMLQGIDVDEACTSGHTKISDGRLMTGACGPPSIIS
jgi:uncharacterized membrane protein